MGVCPELEYEGQYQQWVVVVVLTLEEECSFGALALETTRCEGRAMEEYK